MSESKSASVVFTNGSLLAKNAQAAATKAHELAYSAQKTADGKNRVFRGSDPATVPTSGLKEGDLYFTDNAVYTWTGTAWEKTVSDTTGAEIHAKVEAAMQESQKAVADLKSDVEAKVKNLDDEIAKNKIQTGNALSFYKEQYYLSTSYTELTGGSWSDEVPPRKVEGKYVWSRYVTANVGDPTNQQYSDPVCISGLDGKDGEQGPQGPQGLPSYTHIAYANSADGKTDFDVSNSTGKTYIGIYVDSNAEDSTDPNKYNWTLIKGADGAQGVPGPKGADGRTPYFHVAYANIVQLAQELSSPNFALSAQTVVRFGDQTSERWLYKELPAGNYTATVGLFGSDPAWGAYKVVQAFSDFSVKESSGRAYIGQYTDYTQADSTDPARYKWAKIKGETGPTGATGPKGEPGSTGFFIGTTPPPNPSKGAVWATNDASGNMVSAKTWNGSNWVSTAFTQDLVAGNITATKIQGGELDINKFTVKNAQNIPITSTVSLGDKLSNIEQNANGITAYIKGARGSDTLNAILSMDPNNSTIGQVVNGHVVAAINTSSDGSVKIDGKSLHITIDTKIENAVIKSAMIDSIDASKITTGTLDASHINVINLDANSITAGSLSAAVYKATDFEDWNLLKKSWDFDQTKTRGKWFLNGETTCAHVYNGPRDTHNNPVTPYMYVTSEVSPNKDRVTVTVWKDNDPTQYQRVWNGWSWTPWVMLPNSQNLVSAINLNQDGVKIRGEKIELDGKTTITGELNLLPGNERRVVQSPQDYHNPWAWHDAKVYAGGGGIQLQSTVENQGYSDGTSISRLRRWQSPAITTLAPTYLKFTLYPSWNDINIDRNQFSNLLTRTYIDAGRIETPEVYTDEMALTGLKIRSRHSASLYISNKAGGNFDNNGSVGFQVWGGIGLGKQTIYTPSDELFIQNGNVGPGFDDKYDKSRKTKVHCQKVISEVANTISSRLSVKTDITKVSYDRALAAVEGTEMYDYRYIDDDSGQHYVSGIIDDVNPDPQYHMDDMLINKERTARIDANLVGYHHVILQALLKKIDTLEIKLKSLETRLESKEK